MPCYCKAGLNKTSTNSLCFDRQKEDLEFKFFASWTRKSRCVFRDFTTQPSKRESVWCVSGSGEEGSKYLGCDHHLWRVQTLTMGQLTGSEFNGCIVTLALWVVSLCQLAGGFVFKVLKHYHVWMTCFVTNHQESYWHCHKVPAIRIIDRRAQ